TENQAEPIARQPALVIPDHLDGAHLLGALLCEHRLVGIGEERTPAAEVADRAPELAGGGPSTRLHRDRVPDAIHIRLPDVAPRRRRLRIETQAREADRLEEFLTDV